MNEAFPANPAELESSVERNQHQLGEILNRARKLADNASWREETPSVSEMGATLESSWQVGQRGELSIDLAPQTVPGAEMLLTYREFPKKSHGGADSAEWEKRYLLARNPDGDLMLMVPDAISADSARAMIEQTDAFLDGLSADKVTEDDVAFAKLLAAQAEHETQRSANVFELAAPADVADLQEIVDVAVSGDSHVIAERRRQQMLEARAKAEATSGVRKAARGVLAILNPNGHSTRSPRHRRNNR